MRYAKGLGRKVSAFERKLIVPGVKVRRDYDASFKLASGAFHDVDVKSWKSFSKTAKWMKRGGNGVRPGKEAWKLQKDIVLKFLDPDGPGPPDFYSNLQWAIPRDLQGRRGAIGEWMLDQFDSEFVTRHIPDRKDWEAAKAAFTNALARNLLDFY